MTVSGGDLTVGDKRGLHRNDFSEHSDLLKRGSTHGTAATLVVEGNRMGLCRCDREGREACTEEEGRFDSGGEHV